MAVNKYSRVIQPAQMRQMSYEDVARVPIAYQKYELTAQDALSNMDLAVPSLSLDKPVVSAVSKELEDKIESLSNNIATQGINQKDLNEVMKLQSQYKKLMSPSGKLGQIKSTYEQAQKWAEEVRKTNKDWSPDLVEKYISSTLSGSRTFAEDDTEYLNAQSFSGSYLPKFIDIQQRTGEYLSGYRGSQILQEGAPAEYNGYTAEEVYNDPVARKFIDSDVLFNLLVDRYMTDVEAVRSGEALETLLSDNPEPLIKSTTVTENGETVVKREVNLNNNAVRQLRTIANLRGYDEFRTAGRGGTSGGTGGQVIPGLGVDAMGRFTNENTRKVDILYDGLNRSSEAFTTSQSLVQENITQSNSRHGIHQYILGDNFATYFDNAHLGNVSDDAVINFKRAEIKSEDYLNNYSIAINKFNEYLDNPNNTAQGAIQQFVQTLSPYLEPSKQDTLSLHLESMMQTPEGVAELRNTFMAEADAIDILNQTKTSYQEQMSILAEYYDDVKKAYANDDKGFLKRLEVEGLDSDVVIRTAGPEPAAEAMVADRAYEMRNRNNAAYNIGNENLDVLTQQGPLAFKITLENKLKDQLDKGELNKAEYEQNINNLDIVVEKYTTKLKTLLIDNVEELQTKIVENNLVFDINEASLDSKEYNAIKTQISGLTSSLDPATSFIMNAMDNDGNPLTIQKYLQNEKSWEAGAQKKTYDELIKEADVRLVHYKGKIRAALKLPGLKNSIILDDDRNTILKNNLDGLLSVDPSKPGSIYYSLDSNVQSAKQVLRDVYLEQKPQAKSQFYHLRTLEQLGKSGTGKVQFGSQTLIFNVNPNDIQNPVQVLIKDANGGTVSVQNYANVNSAFTDIGVKFRNVVSNNL